MKSITINGWSFTEVKETTKRGQSLFIKSQNYEGFSINEVYGRASKEKYISFERIREFARKLGANMPHITGHNCCTYSCCFEDLKGNLYYFTAYHNYIVK